MSPTAARVPRDVARITDGPEEPSSYVFMGLGPAAEEKGLKVSAAGQYEAVTIAVSKKKGTNASTVAADAIEKVEALRGSLIPSDVRATVTRDYGETARDKSNELLDHMLIATISSSSSSRSRGPQGVPRGGRGRARDPGL
jgi:multidrug efflux pump subunit AcrB